MDYRDEMTNAQRGLMDWAAQDAINCIHTMLTAAKALSGAVVSLPHINEQGASVTHGCNKTVKRQSATFVEVAVTLLYTLDNSLADEICEMHGFRRSKREFK